MPLSAEYAEHIIFLLQKWYPFIVIEENMINALTSLLDEYESMLTKRGTKLYEHDKQIFEINELEN